MKKLLLAATVAVVAMGLNAATVTWSATKGALYDGADTPAKLTSGNAYLMFVTSTYTQDSLVSAFAAANGDATATLAAMTASGALATTAGTISSANSRPSGTSSYDMSADGTAYFVVFNGDNMFVSYTTDAIYDPVSGTALATFGTALTSSSKTMKDAADGFAGASWYKAVPEPTTGLLMLLGVAGLALKRKRA